MKNFKRFSATLFMAPFLFVGCVSEKTASIKPLNLEKKIVTLDENKTTSHEDKLLASAIFGGEISLTDTDTKSIEKLTTQTLKLDKGWKEFTKEDEILETAEKFLGVKYVWAANGPSAFDCSGFTRYVFKKNGISLPRHSGNQALIGKKIKFSQLQKGDLVFFDTEKKFRNHVNHVGIFMGDNKFIHASSGGKRVMITSFAKKKFYRNKFLYARRVINVGNSFALNLNTKQDHSIN